MVQSRVSEQVGRTLGGRYRLIQLIGTGAAGYVFLAEDDRLGRRVAVKLLHTGLVGDDAFLRRFRAEARGAAALSHPNIVGVLDWGEDDDGPYLVMDHLGGGSLRDLLGAGHRLSVPQATGMGLEAARGLAYAHRRGLVHRDIKPANLLFDEDGRLAVADFGLARALAEAAWTEPMGALIGTVRYSSPEAAQGQTVDGRADLYALGLVLIEAVSGSVPFRSDTALASLMARVGATPEIPESIGALGPIVADLTRIDPNDRVDAPELVRTLEGLATRLARPGPLPLVRPRVETDPTNPLGGDGGGLMAGSPTLVVPAQVGAHPASVGPGLGSVGPAPPAGTAPAGTPPAGTAPAGQARPAGTPPAGVAQVDEAPRGRRPWLIGLGVLVALVLAGGAYFAVRTITYVPRYKVPNLYKLSRAQAAADLTPGKFHLAQVGSSYSATVQRGYVDSQVPAAGDLRPRRSTIDVKLSKGPQPVAVPSITDQAQAAAVARLKSVGLVPKVTTAYNETVASGRVIRYTPDTGVHLPGTTVDVVVSEGPKPRIVPSFAPDTSYATAVAALRGEQLVPAKTTAYSDSVDSGDVIASSPGPGQSTPRGSTVTLTVSLGPHLATVPSDLYGESGSSAAAQLKAAGFIPAVYGPNPTNGPVVYSDPSPGQTVDYGTAVTVYVL